MTSLLRSASLFLISLLAASRLLAVEDGQVTLTAPIANQTVSADRDPIVIDLRNHFGTSNVTGNLVRVDTNQGNMTWELNQSGAPANVANFLFYVRQGRYSNSIIHRCPDPDFVAQGGGYLSPNLTAIVRQAPVVSEFNRSNVRGTISFAKSPGDPDSATSEWFINLADNSANLDSQNGGFTVFAEVIGTGMSVADAIAAVPRVDLNPGNPNDAFNDLPLTDGTPPPSASNLVIVHSIREATLYPQSGSAPSHITFNAVAANTSLVTTNITASNLTLTFGASLAQRTSVTVNATDVNGNTVSSTFEVRLAPSNDQFSAAFTLNGTVDSEVATSNGATKQPGEPDHAGNAGGASLWYRWTAPSDAPVTITTDGTAFDTLLAVYTGNWVRDLTPVVSNDNHDGLTTSEVTFQPVAGTTYQIAVDGRDGASGGRLKIALRTAASGAPVAGRYVGVVAGDETIHALNGYIDLRLNSRGGFSAVLVAGKRTLRFSGGFGSSGTYIRKFGGSDDLELKLVLGNASITGDLWSGDYGGSLEADWIAPSVAGGVSTVPPGRYTFAFDIPPQPDGNATVTLFNRLNLPTVPGGHGFASGIVRADGLALFSGQLADGEAFNVSGPISSAERMALGIRVRDGREIVAGFLAFSVSGNNTTLSGNVGWTKTQIDDDRFFPAGFAETVGVTGGFYQVPAHNELVIALPRTPDNAQFNVTGGNLRFELDPVVGTLRRDNSFRDFERVSFDFDRTTGLLEGRFYDYGAWATRSWQAVALRRSDEILGWFSGERGTGAITITEVTEEPAGNGTITDPGIGGF
jgi:cyclophilin family peptidyl-prolyl cis-trans isomerase